MPNFLLLMGKQDINQTDRCTTEQLRFKVSKSQETRKAGRLVQMTPKLGGSLAWVVGQEKDVLGEEANLK